MSRFEQQELPFMDRDRSVAGPHLPKPVPQHARKRRVIQDLLLEEGIWAVKQACQHVTLKSLEKDLVSNLKQQSKETRNRYASSITKWFFPDQELESPAVLVWRNYQELSLTTEVLRVLYLKAEPIVGMCVQEFLYPIQENAVVPASYFDSYLLTALADIPHKTRSRLKQNLRKLGFLSKLGPGQDLLRPINPTATAMFLLFTHYLACDEVRTVEMRTILADPFWKYLGFKSEDGVRRILRKAANAELLGKYVVADQLELITTALTFRQCLDRRVQL